LQRIFESDNNENGFPIMDKQLLDEVIACLPEERTFFHYHRDRYVLLLLEELQRQGTVRTVADLKRTPHAHWLQKAFVKQWLAAQGRADLPVGALLAHWPNELPHFTYLLSLGRWGSDRRDHWLQTSRPGWNLVLHLNLPMQHLRRLRDAGHGDPRRLQGRSHPHDGNRLTLAWTRIDLDLARNEALIEEVQSDWMRDIARLQGYALRQRERGQATMKWRGEDCRTSDLLAYAALLQPQEKIWQEAMLAAALWFLWRELGIRRVYYHSWSTGIAVKHLDPEWAPPRSLYTELPERFGFRRAAAGPEFLERDRRVQRVRRIQPDWSWYHWAA
jgi:hypothetical protein